MRWEVPRSGKNRCGLGLNQNLPFLDRHVFVSKIGYIIAQPVRASISKPMKTKSLYK
jgi:hypothetical protein